MASKLRSGPPPTGGSEEALCPSTFPSSGHSHCTGCLLWLRVEEVKGSLGLHTPALSTLHNGAKSQAVDGSHISHGATSCSLGTAKPTGGCRACGTFAPVAQLEPEKDVCAPCP